MVDDDLVYGVLLLVALVGCFLTGNGDCVKILCSGLIGMYTGSVLGGRRVGRSDGDGGVDCVDDDKC